MKRTQLIRDKAKNNSFNRVRNTKRTYTFIRGNSCCEASFEQHACVINATFSEVYPNAQVIKWVTESFKGNPKDNCNG
jgi:hypothetical protein